MESPLTGKPKKVYGKGAGSPSGRSRWEINRSHQVQDNRVCEGGEGEELERGIPKYGLYGKDRHEEGDGHECDRIRPPEEVHPCKDEEELGVEGNEDEEEIPGAALSCEEEAGPCRTLESDDEDDVPGPEPGWNGESLSSFTLALLSSSSPAQSAPTRRMNPAMAIGPRFLQRKLHASPWRMVAAKARERTCRDIFPS